MIFQKCHAEMLTYTPGEIAKCHSKTRKKPAAQDGKNTGKKLALAVKEFCVRGKLAETIIHSSNKFIFENSLTLRSTKRFSRRLS